MQYHEQKYMIIMMTMMTTMTTTTIMMMPMISFLDNLGRHFETKAQRRNDTN